MYHCIMSRVGSKFASLRHVHCLLAPSFVLVLLMAMIAALVVPVGASGTVHVDPAQSGTAPSCGSASDACRTIESANSVAAAGDTIQLAPGTYTRR